MNKDLCTVSVALFIFFNALLIVSVLNFLDSILFGYIYNIFSRILDLIFSPSSRFYVKQTNSLPILKFRFWNVHYFVQRWRMSFIWFEAFLRFYITTKISFIDMGANVCTTWKAGVQVTSVSDPLLLKT